MATGPLAHVVRADLVAIFQPYQMVLTILGKVRFHYEPATNRLHRPSHYNVYILSTLLVVSGLFLYSIAMIYEHNETFLVNYLLLTSAYYLIFATTGAHIACTNKSGRVITSLERIQHLEQSMRLPKHREHYAALRRNNVIAVMGVLLFHFGLLLMEVALMRKFEYFSAFICLTRLSIDVEVSYYMSHVAVLSTRINYYIKHILKKAHRSNVHALHSYTNIVRALKLINHTWSFQLMMLFAGEFYLVSRSMTMQMRYIRAIREVAVQHQFAMNCIFLIRHLLTFYLPSQCGQRLTNMLNEIEVYCAKQRYSNESELKKNIAVKILSLHKVYKPGLRIANFHALKIDGKWPLTVLAAFAASIVVMLGLER